MILINGKTVGKIAAEDLNALIGNSDYIENQYIDYKELFAFCDERLPADMRKQKAIEFKNDICSFANAEGGYIFVGISDKNGIPDALVGIDIKNRNLDKYELDIREKLANIQPKIPSVKVHFVELKNGKYIVVLEIAADGFAPYVYNSGNDMFDFVSRDGNGKRRMSYNQVMRMFNQSLIIRKEIETFRESRVQFYSKLREIPLYCRVYVISQDFLDVSAHKRVYMMYRENRTLVTCPSGFSFISPNADGVKFLAYRDDYGKEIYLRNNGICEVTMCLEDGYYLHYHNNKWSLSGCAIWNDIILEHIKYSVEHLIRLGYNKKAYICFDLSCYKGTITDDGDYHKPQTDRNLIMSSVVEVDDISNDEILNESIRNLNYEYFMALGIRSEEKYKQVETTTYI